MKLWVSWNWSWKNCVFTFQDRFYKQLHGAAMGSPCSPVVANIYMEYFENMALGPELPVPIKDWKRYVDDVFSIIPKGKPWQFVKIFKFHWSTHKIYHWTTKCWGRNPLFGHLPQATRRRHSSSSLQKANPYRQISGLQLQPPCLGQKSCGKSLNG